MDVFVGFETAASLNKKRSLRRKSPKDLVVSREHNVVLPRANYAHVSAAVNPGSDNLVGGLPLGDRARGSPGSCSSNRINVMRRTRVIILGAAGRDFHNFNVYFRKRADYEVVAFTAAQIPNIADRTYPPTLAGPLYPRGIPIFPETELSSLIAERGVGEVVHAYSDISHAEVMHKASAALAAGADFRILGLGTTCLESRKPVVAVCAVRTGAGKSPTSQFVADYLRYHGLRVGVVRHPMPYGDLVAMEVQRFGSYEDFDRYDTTIEEREEYEPYVRKGIAVFAGVDYLKILRRAEKEADVILWDGGNNDMPFYTPDLYITVVDPHRPGHGVAYHPGETNLRAADIVLISKARTASPEGIREVQRNIREVNPGAAVYRTYMKIHALGRRSIRGKRVIVVEDGPTLTHGEMTYGAGMIYARERGARIINASRWAVGSIRDVYAKFTHLEKILPAMGYGSEQIRELETTINRARADVVVAATPVDLGRLIQIDKPLLQVRYTLIASAGLRQRLGEFARQVQQA